MNGVVAELKEAFDVLRQDLDCISSAGKASTTVQASRISEGKLEDICARLRVRFWWDPPGFPVKVLYDISQDHIDSNSREWSTLWWVPPCLVAKHAFVPCTASSI